MNRDAQTTIERAQLQKEELALLKTDPLLHKRGRPAAA
jgi:hypothetical protein